MKEHGYLITASAIVLVLAIALSIRISIQKAGFNRIVQDALETSEGYDEKFIQMVNTLEEELAQRASFGYKGQKDPMTGKIRTVVQQIAAPRKTQQAKTQISDVSQKEEPQQDPVKLTAIIYDDEKKVHTAIVMDGERSYSVETGDRLRDRQITKITNEVIFMESPTALYRYDIYGVNAIKNKE